MRIHFEKTHTFWESAHSLSKRLHFEQTPIFCVYANILGKRQYFNDFAISFVYSCNEFLLDSVAANVCVYFQYLFVHFCVRQYFWRNCFEA